jgi:hypothetical protein
MKRDRLFEVGILVLMFVITLVAMSGCAHEKEFCSEHYDYNGRFYNRTCTNGHYHDTYN